MVTVASCDDAENPLYVPQDNFVQMETRTASTAEDGDPMTLNVALGSVDNPNGTSVNFDVIISSGDASRFNIEPSNGILEIPAGEFTGQITVTPIDNLENDGNVNLSIELVQTDNLKIGVAGLGNEKTAASLVINDNDCPTIISSQYGVEVFAFDAEAPGHTVELVAVDGTDKQWTVVSSWGPNFVGWATGNSGFNGLYPYSGTIVLNDDFTVDFIGDAGWATGGSGTYSACDDQFNITLTQALFSSSFTVDVVMTGK